MFPLNYDNTGVTVELRELIESGIDIWNFEYPTPASVVEYNGKTAKVPFDKTAFQQKIIDHYYFRQIGQETPGRWLHHFRSRMREIMPYYVQLYEFEAKWFNVDDPLESYNLKETFEQESEGSGKVNGTTTDTSSAENSSNLARTGSGDSSTTRNASGTSEKDGNTSNTRKFSNTPQGSIENLDKYMTEATQETGTNHESITSSEGSSETLATAEEVNETTGGTATANASGTSETTSEDSGTLRHTLTRRGNIGVQPLGSEVRDIRQAFINIDAMVINELKDLFLQVY